MTGLKSLNSGRNKTKTRMSQSPSLGHRRYGQVAPGTPHLHLMIKENSSVAKRVIFDAS